MNQDAVTVFKIKKGSFIESEEVVSLGNLDNVYRMENEQNTKHEKHETHRRGCPETPLPRCQWRILS